MHVTKKMKRDDDDDVCVEVVRVTMNSENINLTTLIAYQNGHARRAYKRGEHILGV